MLGVDRVGLPYAYDGLVALGYGLMLPAIAVLHARNALVRESGAVLGTIAGTATVAVGLGGSVAVDLRPAALVILGVWWWTIGKMWTETGALHRAFGIVTAALGALAFVAGPAAAASGALLVAGSVATGQAWSLVQAVIGSWLVLLALVLARERDVPSR